MKENKSFKELVSEYIIEIPMIQRDYAYGRAEEKEKRVSFLKSIKKSLQSRNTRELDFIYGSVVDGKLVLLDGQQRITTLFLMHWYFASFDESNFDDFKSFMSNDNNESKFTYKTRPSSTDFCNEIIKHSFEEVYENNEYKLSECIRNKKWFLMHWKFDPTITSMLNMLDSVYEIFPKNECPEYYGRLTKDRIIVFNFLDLEEFKLTDELYIKMNSRGRALTRFENLKSIILKLYDEARSKGVDKSAAKLESINKGGSKTFNSLREYVALMFDTEWTDTCWNEYRSYIARNKDNDESYIKSLDIDNMMLNFISIMAISQYALAEMDGKLSIPRKSECVDFVNRLMDKKDKNIGSLIGYDEFLKLFKTNDYEFLYKLIDYFNALKYISDNKIKNDYYNYEDLFDVIINEHKNDRQYEEKVKLISYLKYVCDNYNIDKKSSDDWMRFVCRVCDNSTTLANSADTFLNSLAAFDYLYDRNISTALQNKDLGNIVTLDMKQIEEEKFKFRLSMKSEKWREAIKKAETDLEYLKGRLSFVFIECCGFDIQKDDIDESEIGKFKSYVAKIHNIFPDKDGCKKESYLQIALLSKGNYLIEKWPNHSLLKNNDRDISWYRLLKDGVEGKSLIFKKVLDEINIDFSKEIKVFANELVLDNAYNWQKMIVKHPQILDKIHFSDKEEFSIGSDKYLRWNNSQTAEIKNRENADENDNCEIDIISKVRMSSRHAELFSLCIYLDILAKEEKESFLNGYTLNYKTTSTDSLQPYCYLENDTDKIIKILYKDNNKLYVFKTREGENVSYDNITPVCYDDVISTIISLISNV